PASSEAGWLQLLAAAAAFWLVRDAGRGNRVLLHWGPRLLAITAGLLALEALAQLAWTPQRVFGYFPVSVATPMGPFVNRDDFAVFIELTVPFALMLGSRARRFEQSLLWCALAGLARASVAVSGSRGCGMVGTVELAAMLGLHLRWAQPSPQSRLSRHSRELANTHRRWTTGGMVALLTPAVVIASRPSALVYRMHNPGPSLVERFSFI